MSTFTLDIANFAKRAGEKADLVRKKVALEILTRVVLKTPVDTGRARGNWQVGEAAAGNQLDTTDPSGSSAIAAGQAAIDATPPEQQTILISNSLPYIHTLEYGGYPNPPKTGTKTTGGYSKQAPQGMVRVTLVEFRDAVAAAIQASK